MTCFFYVLNIDDDRLAIHVCYSFQAVTTGVVKRRF